MKFPLTAAGLKWRVLEEVHARQGREGRLEMLVEERFEEEKVREIVSVCKDIG